MTVKDSQGSTLEYMKYMANAGRGTSSTSGCPSTTTQTYYSMDWQVLQKVDTISPPPPCQSGVTTSTYVWSLSYIDDLVAKDCDNPSGRTYVQQDANHNVTALVNTSGSVTQRMIYDPYGVATVLTNGWGSSGNAMFEYGHQGGRYDSISGLYNFRMRDYSPTLGRWMQQDPMGYVDGMSLYEYVRSEPVASLDPSGLLKISRAIRVARQVLLDPGNYGLFTSEQIQQLGTEEAALDRALGPRAVLEGVKMALRTIPLTGWIKPREFDWNFAKISFAEYLCIVTAISASGGTLTQGVSFHDLKTKYVYDLGGDYALAFYPTAAGGFKTAVIRPGWWHHKVDAVNFQLLGRQVNADIAEAYGNFAVVSRNSLQTLRSLIASINTQPWGDGDKNFGTARIPAVTGTWIYVDR
ncbi:MAG: RHS repeat-associated core domain-containing protein [Planctomycetota bacterium]|nr:RHS repeat-associated core domain-containing protein [Planctomycetota bacterium]